VYAPPPAVSVNAYARPVNDSRTVVAVAEFANPDSPQLDWPDVGLEMTKAMRRAIYNEGELEVRIAPAIEQKVSTPGFLRSEGPVGGSPVEVDYVIVGKVTDFHHTAALPKDASRWGLFGRRKEAVVAIEWRVVDVQARRVVAADHSYGTAEASRKKSIDELYDGLNVSAYLFWNTPLGRAAHMAVDRSIERMRELLPSRAAGQPTVLQVMGPREVSIKGGWKWGLAEGQELYVTEQPEGRRRGCWARPRPRPGWRERSSRRPRPPLPTIWPNGTPWRTSAATTAAIDPTTGGPTAFAARTGATALPRSGKPCGPGSARQEHGLACGQSRGTWMAPAAR
jgi:hypothetical protein